MENKKEEISDKYLNVEETYTLPSELKKGRLKHFSFYVWIIIFIIINVIAASGIETRKFKFNGFKDWGGSISLLVLEVIFLFIYGARSQITHLEVFLDKISTISPLKNKKQPF